MGTSFLQMAYNMIDMIWIGRLGAASVAAVGTAGFFMWLSMSFIALTRVGAEVNIAQALGAKDIKKANINVSTSMLFTLILALLYVIFIILFKDKLIGFFNLNDVTVEGYAKEYLFIIAFGMIFSFFNQVISGMYNAAGHSSTPFRINSIGLIINMILDPLLIFGLDLGVKGAAIATIIAQFAVAMMFLVTVYQNKRPYSDFTFREKPSLKVFKSMLKIALPVAMQSGLFTIIAMFVARIVAMHGTTAIAVQKVGTQIEAVSYMTAQGFGAALSAFVGQNKGANEIKRVKDGFKTAGIIMAIIGIIVSVALYVAAEPIFKMFISEEPALSMGVVYLRILSFSQFFMCIEITIAGGFNGLKRSLPPAVVSVLFNAFRIPFAYVLSVYTILGLNGIWWSISISSVLKGTVLILVLLLLLNKMKKTNNS